MELKQANKKIMAHLIRTYFDVSILSSDDQDYIYLFCNLYLLKSTFFYVFIHGCIQYMSLSIISFCSRKYSGNQMNQHLEFVKLIVRSKKDFMHLE
jgi:hypothetical protein